MTVPVFGRVSTLPEVLNIYDNFGLEELRDNVIELVLKKHPNPLVIDCGVNVGITVRWWLRLNLQGRVIGVDMLHESIEFASASIRSGPHAEDSKRFQGLEGALYSEEGVEFEVAFDNPLHGNNSLFGAHGNKLTRRKLKSTTLDHLVGDVQDSSVTLLKIDLEGAGGKALAGATKLLGKTNHVVFESHSEMECREASRVLFQEGFLMRRVATKNTWWERAA